MEGQMKYSIIDRFLLSDGVGWEFARLIAVFLPAAFGLIMGLFLYVGRVY
jgi:hypothetical protein